MSSVWLVLGAATACPLVYSDRSWKYRACGALGASMESTNSSDGSVRCKDCVCTDSSALDVTGSLAL